MYENQSLCGGVVGQFPKNTFTKNYIKCPDLHQKSVSHPNSMSVWWGLHTKTFFARNFMKCPDLNTKVMYGIHTPWGTVG